MSISAKSLRFVLGLKVKSLRQERGLTLTEAARRAGISVSYLSEIEKGKKYPKPERLLNLATTLEVSFDELVSLRVKRELDPLKAAFSSPFVREFPFELFGLEPGNLLDLVTDDPGKAGALIRTFLEIGRMYDVEVEHFLLAALRSYQELKGNYFGQIESEASGFREGRGWPIGKPLGPDSLREILESEHGYEIDLDTLAGHPYLNSFRWVFVDASRPRLFVNGLLLPSQVAFIYAYQIGYQHLRLPERTFTASTWPRFGSFEQVLNNFKASYFAGAMLIDEDDLQNACAKFIARDRWDGSELVRVMQRYDATPEMFFYRLTQVVPHRFGLGEIYFVRFGNDVGTDRYRLTKVLNLSRVPVPHGIGMGEHHCRRWPAIQLLRELARNQQVGAANEPLVMAQRSRFFDEDVEFLVLSMARSLSLPNQANSAVSLGFLIDRDFRREVSFWNDPSIPRADVHLTCERCPLSENDCQDRTAPPVAYQARRAQERKMKALDEFIESSMED